MTTTLSLMSITPPEEGRSSPVTFEAAGVNNGFEASFRGRSGRATRSSPRTSAWPRAGASDKLFPWRSRSTSRGLAPGTYTFVAKNDDPSGGAEGNGPDVDTRTIVVE